MYDANEDRQEELDAQADTPHSTNAHVHGTLGMSASVPSCSSSGNKNAGMASSSFQTKMRCFRWVCAYLSFPEIVRLAMTSATIWDMFLVEGIYYPVLSIYEAQRYIVSKSVWKYLVPLNRLAVDTTTPQTVTASKIQELQAPSRLTQTRSLGSYSPAPAFLPESESHKVSDTTYSTHLGTFEPQWAANRLRLRTRGVATEAIGKEWFLSSREQQRLWLSRITGLKCLRVDVDIGGHKGIEPATLAYLLTSNRASLQELRVFWLPHPVNTRTRPLSEFFYDCWTVGDYPFPRAPSGEAESHPGSEASGSRTSEKHREAPEARSGQLDTASASRRGEELSSFPASGPVKDNASHNTPSKASTDSESSSATSTSVLTSAATLPQDLSPRSAYFCTAAGRRYDVVVQPQPLLPVYPVHSKKGLERDFRQQRCVLLRQEFFSTTLQYPVARCRCIMNPLFEGGTCLALNNRPKHRHPTGIERSETQCAFLLRPPRVAAKMHPWDSGKDMLPKKRRQRWAVYVRVLKKRAGQKLKMRMRPPRTRGAFTERSPLSRSRVPGSTDTGEVGGESLQGNPASHLPSTHRLDDSVQKVFDCESGKRPLLTFPVAVTLQPRLVSQNGIELLTAGPKQAPAYRYRGSDPATLPMIPVPKTPDTCPAETREPCSAVTCDCSDPSLRAVVQDMKSGAAPKVARADRGPQPQAFFLSRVRSVSPAREEPHASFFPVTEGRLVYPTLSFSEIKVFSVQLCHQYASEFFSGCRLPSCELLLIEEWEALYDPQDGVFPNLMPRAKRHALRKHNLQFLRDAVTDYVNMYYKCPDFHGAYSPCSSSSCFSSVDAAIPISNASPSPLSNAALEPSLLAAATVPPVPTYRPPVSVDRQALPNAFVLPVKSTVSLLFHAIQARYAKSAPSPPALLFEGEHVYHWLPVVSSTQQLHEAHILLGANHAHLRRYLHLFIFCLRCLYRMLLNRNAQTLHSMSCSTGDILSQELLLYCAASASSDPLRFCTRPDGSYSIGFHGDPPGHLSRCFPYLSRVDCERTTLVLSDFALRIFVFLPYIHWRASVVLLHSERMDPTTGGGNTAGGPSSQITLTTDAPLPPESYWLVPALSPHAFHPLFRPQEWKYAAYLERWFLNLLSKQIRTLTIGALTDAFASTFTLEHKDKHQQARQEWRKRFAARTTTKCDTPYAAHLTPLTRSFSHNALPIRPECGTLPLVSGNTSTPTCEFRGQVYNGKSIRTEATGGPGGEKLVSRDTGTCPEVSVVIKAPLGVPNRQQATVLRQRISASLLRSFSSPLGIEQIMTLPVVTAGSTPVVAPSSQTSESPHRNTATSAEGSDKLDLPSPSAPLLRAPSSVLLDSARREVLLDIPSQSSGTRTTQTIFGTDWWWPSRGQLYHEFFQLWTTLQVASPASEGASEFDGPRERFGVNAHRSIPGDRGISRFTNLDLILAQCDDEWPLLAAWIPRMLRLPNCTRLDLLSLRQSRGGEFSSAVLYQRVERVLQSSSLGTPGKYQHPHTRTKTRLKVHGGSECPPELFVYLPKFHLDIDDLELFRRLLGDATVRQQIRGVAGPVPQLKGALQLMQQKFYQWNRPNIKMIEIWVPHTMARSLASAAHITQLLASYRHVTELRIYPMHIPRFLSIANVLESNSPEAELLKDIVRADRFHRDRVAETEIYGLYSQAMFVFTRPTGLRSKWRQWRMASTYGVKTFPPEVDE